MRNASGQIIVNADGTPAINPTKQYLGKFTPDWLGGINNSFTYKGSILVFLLMRAYGGSIYSKQTAQELIQVYLPPHYQAEMQRMED